MVLQNPEPDKLRGQSVSATLSRPRGAAQLAETAPGWLSRTGPGRQTGPISEGGGAVDFEYSKRTREYLERLSVFMDTYVYPNEQTFADQLCRAADAVAGAPRSWRS